MNILVGCECSGALRSRFRLAGHNAWSCDLKEAEDESYHHLQTDITLAIPTKWWDLIILHPDCTAMAVSGNRWYGRNMPRHNERLEAVEWTLKLWELAKKHSDKVALENPVSVIFSHLPNVFYLQPWQHGHGETKKTGFALHNLDPITPTNIVEGREQRIWKMAPGPNRKTDRSRTYTGVADAIVSQWSKQMRESEC